MSGKSILIGIDGGGSRGRLLATDTTGKVLARAETGPLNINNLKREEILANLTTGLDQLGSHCNGFPGGILGISAGVAGIKEREDGIIFEGLLAQATGLTGPAVEAVNDIVILQAAGLGGQPGIALILGTGSHCFGQNAAGDTVTCGGWGYLMDDCGGGYAIGHAALRAAVRMWDGRLPASPLASRVLEYLGISRPGASLQRIHNTDFGFDDVKALAPIVADLAANGDNAALDILRAAANDGAELVTVVRDKLALGESPQVAVTGGVACNVIFRSMLLEALRRTLPGVKLVDPTLPPVAGAVVRVALRAGLPVDRDFLSHLAKGTEGLG